MLCCHAFCSAQGASHAPQTNALTARLAAQQAATASGDPARVAESSRSLIAVALREMAALRVAGGDATEAAGIDRQSLELEPSTETQLDLAEALAAAQRIDEARGMIAQVLAAEPHNARALRLRALLMRQAATKPATHGSPRHAETLALRTREGQLRRTLATAYNDWGTAQARQQDYRGALGLFGEGEHWDPTAPGLMRNEGMAAFRLEDFGQSARAFAAALEAEPASRQSSEAVQQTRVLLGLSLFSTQQYAEAAKAFAAAETVTYSNARATYAWAFSLAHLNDPQHAAAVLERLMAMPMAPDEQALACQVYDQIEDYDHSVMCFRKLLALDDFAHRAHFELGAALIRLNRPAEAVPELRAEIAHGDQAPDVRYHLAYALLETQQAQEAEQLLTGIVAEQPGYAEAQYQLGKLRLEQGQVKEAIQHLELAAQATPEEPFIHYQLQSAYRRDGRTADADREMQRYRELKAKTRGAPAAR